MKNHIQRQILWLYHILFFITTGFVINVLSSTTTEDTAMLSVQNEDQFHNIDVENHTANDKITPISPTTTTLSTSPYFDTSISSNVTSIVGDTAILNCRITNLRNKTVVWVRHRDIHLLTVDKTTYSADDRFRSLHDLETDIWSLQIKSAKKGDTGIYECQIATTPPVGIPIYLAVVEPITLILGGPDLYISAGSTINLTCIIQNLPIPPSSIFWTHNNEVIGFDSARGGISVITEKGESTITSYLYVQRANQRDSGEYKCKPSNATPYSIQVYVLKGGLSAAMHYQMNDGQNKTKCISIFHIIILLIFIIFF